MNQHPAGCYHCRIDREEDVYLAVSYGRELAQRLGFDAIDCTRIEIAILELTRNQLVHAGGGKVLLAPATQPGSDMASGVLIEASDYGPGIADIALALQDGYSTANTLGVGLPGVQRLMDELHITSQVGVGTTVQAIKWLPPPEKRRQ